MTEPWIACQEPERVPDEGMVFHHGDGDECCFGCCLKYETGLRMFNAEVGPHSQLRFDPPSVDVTAYGQCIKGSRPGFVNWRGSGLVPLDASPSHLVAALYREDRP